MFGPELREEFPAVTRYFVTLAHQPQFKAVVGDVTLAAEEQKYVRAHVTLPHAVSSRMMVAVFCHSDNCARVCSHVCISELAKECSALCLHGG